MIGNFSVIFKDYLVHEKLEIICNPGILFYINIKKSLNIVDY
jgi:hypothetical protein